MPINFDVVNYMGFKAAIFSDLFGIDPYNIGDRDAYIQCRTRLIELCGLALCNNDTVPTEEPNAQEELLKEAVDVLRGIRDNLRKTTYLAINSLRKPLRGSKGLKSALKLNKTHQKSAPKVK